MHRRGRDAETLFLTCFGYFNWLIFSPNPKKSEAPKIVSTFVTLYVERLKLLRWLAWHTKNCTVYTYLTFSLSESFFILFFKYNLVTNFALRKKLLLFNIPSHFTEQWTVQTVETLYCTRLGKSFSKLCHLYVCICTFFWKGKSSDVPWKDFVPQNIFVCSKERLCF